MLEAAKADTESPLGPTGRNAGSKGDGGDAPGFWRLLLKGSSRVASQRLSSLIEEVEAECRRRINGSDEPARTRSATDLRDQLEMVRRDHRRGEMELAWRRLKLVARMQLDVANADELRARAAALRHEVESGKLASDWRKAAILDLVAENEILPDRNGQRDAPRTTDREASNERMGELSSDELGRARTRVIEATRHRDEDADNQYYKIALLREQRSLLLLVLVACMALVVGLTAIAGWDADLTNPSAGFVSLVAVFGAVGACLSAIRSLGEAGRKGRITEHMASYPITITRPALGAAAALGVYAAVVSGILNIAVDGDRGRLTVLALAFAAGFSERLVLAAVEAASGRAESK